MSKKILKHAKSIKLSGKELQGLVVTTYGSYVEVEDTSGQTTRCYLRKLLDPVVTGDQVLWIPDKSGTGTIVSLLPRRSLLARPENKHKLKLVAANIDALIIVTAPPPVFAEDLLDAYLIAAENLQIPAVILINKKDLLQSNDAESFKQRLAVYKKIGYSVLLSSTKIADGLAHLHAFLQNKTCVFVGASGVGKSSIIATLTANNDIRVGEVAAHTQLGKHTTTATRLYHLPNGGQLIDSPGVREFGLWNVSPEEVAKGFLEFKDLAPLCKFRNCSHLHEPNCAVQDAVHNQLISEQRFKHYQKILEQLSNTSF